MIHVFGDFELDPELFELRRKGQRVKVEPRVFNLLAYLVRHRERVILREELLAQLWPGEFVSDDALAYCVKEARRAVGDDGTRQAVIATVQRRGFRFVAPTANALATVSVAAPMPRAAAARPNSAPFVGREAVMNALECALISACDGHGQLALLVGEPGIGKTRTAEELARLARERGLSVLISRCHESEGAPAFWPWIQLLRAYMRSAEVVRLGQPARTIPAVARLLPELSDSVVSDELGVATDSPQARFRLFDQVTRLLQTAAAEKPLLLILDDLHWADKPSLLLLQFVAREMAESPLLIIGTYRDTDIAANPPLSDALGDLVRVSGCLRIALAALSEADVERLLSHSLGGVPEPELVRVVHQETEGNPFFVSEVIGAMINAPGTALMRRSSVLPSVRDAIRRRLHRLSPSCNRALQIASVVGREISLPLLAACWRSDKASAAASNREALLQALDEAYAARVLEEVATAPGSIRFVHTLIRETLYEGLSIAQRAHLHAVVARALLQLHGKNAGPHLNALAHHFSQSMGIADSRLALEYCVRAGHYAAGQLAFEAAALHFEHALTRLPAKAAARRRTEILLALGANQWRAGDFEQARATFGRAAAGARACREPALLAQAALGLGGGFRGFNFGLVEPPLIAVLEEALQRLPGRRSSLRARIMARLAVALYSVEGSLPRRETLSRRAVEMARQVGDDAAHLNALYARHWSTWTPDNLLDRQQTAQTMAELAERTGDLEMALQGHRFRLIDCLEAGDRKSVEHDLARCAAIAERLRQPYYTWYISAFRALRSFLDGDFAASERFSQEALRVGQRARSENVNQAFSAQMLALRREQGRIAEVEPILRGLVQQYPAVTAWRCGLAYVCAELGEANAAREHFEVLARDDFASLPRDAFWMVAMYGLSEVCAFLGDAPRAAMLYDLMAPFHHRMVVNLVGTCISSVGRCLGRLAAVQGRWARANEHFEAAIVIEQGLGAQPLLAHTLNDYAHALMLRGQASDRMKADRLLQRARDAYERLGMQSFAARADKCSRAPRRRQTPRRGARKGGRTSAAISM